MIRSDDHWRALTDAFHAAAIDGQSWMPALDGLADATGSQGGQLICIGADTGIPVNLMTRTDPELMTVFAANGGGDPKVNPRVKAGGEAPLLKVLAESDFISEDERRRHPHYQEFAIPWNIPFICLAPLERQKDMLIGLAVVRTQEQGHITPQQREAFASIAPHVRAAVRTHIALEGSGAALLAGAMEALSVPAFICDSQGRVNALTPSAEALLKGDRGLQLKAGWLYSADAAGTKALNDAIALAAQKCAQPGDPRVRTVIVRSRDSGIVPLVLDVIALPSHHFELRFAPRVLVVARGAKAVDERRAFVLRSAYSLTAAETEIALQLAQGRTAEAIATARAVEVATVRTQIKAILTKMGTRRQIDLVARLNQI